MTEPRLLGDRYELGDVLGRGGMAEVRRGRDRRLGRTVAIKMLRTDLATDPTFQVRFRREAQSAAMLNHSSIVAVYDTGEDILDGARVPFIVMEYVEGKTLREVLQEHPRITPERALEITSGVLDALDYSHRAGIVHRDIKPGNVMITENGDVKVMDFGIARALSDVGATVTQTAAVVGTAQYLSPEQARGETADARSDLYSTGCLLYELLTGRPPFLGDSLVSVAISHVRENPTPPSQVDAGVTPALDAIVMKSLAKDRLERYQSAAEMKADVQRAMAGLPVAAEATTTYLPAVAAVGATDATTTGFIEEPEEEVAGGRSQRHDRRGIGYGALIAAVILVLLAAGAIGWALFRDTGPEDVRVPNVVNATVEDARAELEDAGFELGTQTPAADPNVAAGLIISQDPEAQALVEEGTTVNVVVSTGVAQTEVPQLIGLDQNAARQALEDAGLRAGRIDSVASDRPAGTVVAATPEPGTAASEGTAVDLQVSDGRVEVPDVRDTTEAQATAAIAGAGLQVSVQREVRSDVAEGTVIGQTPEPATRVEPGSLVSITVAQAPPVTPTTPPPTTTPPTTPPPQ